MTVATYSVEHLRFLARNAVVGDYGTIEGLGRATLHLQMDCEDPYIFVMYGSRSDLGNPVKVPMQLEVRTRCRKCASCLRRRSLYWTGRAVEEYFRWPRTYFGTFTMSPEQHMLLDARATLRLAKGRVDFAALSPAEIFKERASEFGLELQRFLKRLRKGDGEHPKPRLRYLLIAERHDSEQTSAVMRDRPHYHMMLHECEVGALVKGDPLETLRHGHGGRSGELECREYSTRKGLRLGVFVHDDAFLRQQWEFGFTKFQWADSPNSAAYVCKYLTKAVMARVRASQNYGVERSTPLITRNENEGEKGSENPRESFDPPSGTDA